MKLLKKIAVLISLTGIILMSIISCEQKKNEEEKKAEEAKAYSARQDSLELVYLNTINEIDRSLDEVIQKQIGVRINIPVESNVPTKAKVINNIQTINSLLAENKEKLDRLNKSISESKIENIQLKELISKTDEKIRRQETILAYLKNQILKKDFELAELNRKMSNADLKNQMLNDIVYKYEHDLNIGYYAYGNFQDLKKQGVVDKKGGLLGIGSAKEVKEDFSEESFTKIDIRQTTSIPLYASKAKVLSTHSPLSYEFQYSNDERITALKIKDPKEFWKTSKFLVMVVK